MNPLARSSRRRIGRSVARQLGLEAIVVAAAVAGLLFRLERLDAQWPLAILAGEFVAGVHLLVAWASNPVSRSYLDGWLDAPEALGGVPFDPAQGRDLRAIGLGPAFSLAARLEPVDWVDGVEGGDAEAALQVAFDVHSAESGMVVALAGRHSSSLTLVSRLSDGRLAVTADQAIPPHPRLVSTVAPATEPREVADAHRQLLQELIGERVRPVPASPELAWEFVTIERDAWAGLGPLVGPLFSLSGRARPLRLGVAVGQRDDVRRSGEASEPTRSGSQGLSAVGLEPQREELISRSATAGRNSRYTTAREPERVA